MNEKAKEYWDKFWNGKEPPISVNAWQFGFDSDGLAQLVIEGKKTATTSNYALYDLENEPLPICGQYSVVLNSRDAPMAIIKSVDVQVLPMNEVSEEYAISEGEGDLSYEYWWNAHKEFFSKELEELGRVFTDDMLVVCERFELIDVNAKAD